MSYEWLWVGLGNPGFDYSTTRHNAGFLALDALKKAFSPVQNSGTLEFQKKDNAFLANARWENHKVLLCKPLSYMNLSGNVVSELLKIHPIPLHNLVVFHDELELPFGTIGWKCGGGHRGHNGLRNISAQCGSHYKRIRIGIGRPPGFMEVSKFVLSSFTAQEKLQLETSLFPSLEQAIPWIFQERSENTAYILKEGTFLNGIQASIVSS